MSGDGTSLVSASLGAVWWRVKRKRNITTLYMPLLQRLAALCHFRPMLQKWSRNAQNARTATPETVAVSTSVSSECDKAGQGKGADGARGAKSAKGAECHHLSDTRWPGFPWGGASHRAAGWQRLRSWPPPRSPLTSTFWSTSIARRRTA